MKHTLNKLNYLRFHDILPLEDTFLSYFIHYVNFFSAHAQLITLMQLKRVSLFSFSPTFIEVN